MTPRVGRRNFLAGTAATALTVSLPLPAIAENSGIRIGLLTVKTGPLAQGGIQMEQGIALFLKHRDNKLHGRPAELIVADTGGNPAGTKTKAQELIERDHVDFIVGPLAAFELLAISDYVAEHKCPILSLAAAEDMTQRKPNPYFVRASATSAQAMRPARNAVASHSSPSSADGIAAVVSSQCWWRSRAALSTSRSAGIYRGPGSQRLRRVNHQIPDFLATIGP